MQRKILVRIERLQGQIAGITGAARRNGNGVARQAGINASSTPIECVPDHKMLSHASNCRQSEDGNESDPAKTGDGAKLTTEKAGDGSEKSLHQTKDRRREEPDNQDTTLTICLGY